MYIYKLGLLCGGLMEDPEWHIEDVRIVKAGNLREAKDKWAKVTKNNIQDLWDAESQTVWGWSVKLIDTNDITVPIEEFHQSKPFDMLNYSSKTILNKIDELQKRYDIAKEHLEQQCLRIMNDDDLNVLARQIDILKWVLNTLLYNTEK